MNKEKEQLAKELFKPYAAELKFGAQDWEVFLNRLSQFEQIVKEEMIRSIIEWAIRNYIQSH